MDSIKFLGLVDLIDSQKPQQRGESALAAQKENPSYREVETRNQTYVERYATSDVVSALAAQEQNPSYREAETGNQT